MARAVDLIHVDSEMDPLLESEENTLDASTGVFLMCLTEQNHTADPSKVTISVAVRLIYSRLTL